MSEPVQFSSPGSPQESIDTLQLRINEAIRLNGTVDPQGIVQHNGKNYFIEDLPTADLRAMLGYGHFEAFWREVIDRPDGKPWLYTPNMCLLAGGHRGVWVDRDHLVCPGCGLDVTP